MKNNSINLIIEFIDSTNRIETPADA